jgi:hypothetical protein
MKERSAHLRHHGESLLIEMKLNTLAQLFNSLDPSPFLEKDLDDDAEAYIVDTAREFPPKASLRLVIHLPQDAIRPDTAESVAHAVHRYFDYKTQIADANLRHKLREGRASLVIGLLFLTACLSARELVAEFGSGTAYEILQEGLLISGWVAMWRPIQIFLYDWRPIRRLRMLYSRLSRIQVDIRPFS